MLITKRISYNKASRYPCDPIMITTKYYLFGFIVIWQHSEEYSDQSNQSKGGE
jgi:hypothetical protein